MWTGAGASLSSVLTSRVSVCPQSPRSLPAQMARVSCAVVMRTLTRWLWTGQLSEQHNWPMLQREAAPGAQGSGECFGSQQKPEHGVDNRGVIQREVVVEVPGQVVPQSPMEHDL